MKKTFTLFLLFSFFISGAQTICGTANEGGIVTLTAPPGNYITAITFASYGTPNGSCGSFTIGGCHAANSIAVCSPVFVGLNSASISATNGVFGDPCGGTVKRLYIEASYSSVLPVRLVGFSATKTTPHSVRVEWTCEQEINMDRYEVERSTDGIQFETAGTLTATEAIQYSFSETISGVRPVYFYRLKMIDRDGRFTISSVVRVHNQAGNLSLAVFPNPATDMVSIYSPVKQDAILSGITGQVIRSVSLVAGSTVIPVKTFAPGMYILRAGDRVIKFMKQ